MSSAIPFPLLDPTSTPDPASLAALGALHSAPVLSQEARERLAAELGQALACCDWFTVGVMAPSVSAAVAALRSLEAALGGPALAEQPVSTASLAEPDPMQSDTAAPVFLKGNQRSGTFWLRPERGLGEGLLISGHRSADGDGSRDAEGTWGPLPLDFFS